MSASRQDPGASKAVTLALLASVQFMVVLDAFIVNVALPSIGHDLDFRGGELSWVVNIYMLMFGGFLLLGGRLGDLMGRRRLLVSGLVVFGVASLAGGLAQSALWLVLARGVQGLAAATISPAVLGIITATFQEGAERNRAMGVWGAVAGSGGATGVLLGGVLTELAGWEWVLFVNVPVALTAAVLAPRLLAEVRHVADGRRLDVAGAVTVTSGLVVGVYTLVEADGAGWTSATTFGRGAVSLALLGLFVVVEKRSAHPLVPFRIFASRALRGCNVIAPLLSSTIAAMFFFVSIYLQRVLGYTPLQTGLAYLPLTVLMSTSSAFTSRGIARAGLKPTLIASLLTVVAGLLWFSRVSAGGSYLGDVLVPSLLVSAGVGCAIVSIAIGATSGTRPEEAGVASGLISTAHQIGGALGVAVLASIAAARTAAVSATVGHDPAVALTEGYRRAFLVGAGVALVAASLAALLLPGGGDSAQKGTPQPAEVLL